MSLQPAHGACKSTTAETSCFFSSQERFHQSFLTRNGSYPLPGAHTRAPGHPHALQPAWLRASSQQPQPGRPFTFRTERPAIPGSWNACACLDASSLLCFLPGPCPSQGRPACSRKSSPLTRCGIVQPCSVLAWCMSLSEHFSPSFLSFPFT